LGNYENIITEFAGNIEVDKDSDFGIFLNTTPLSAVRKCCWTILETRRWTILWTSIKKMQVLGLQVELDISEPIYIGFMSHAQLISANPNI
jgi:hypothetical protein